MKKEPKLTYRECAKGLKKLLNQKYGHKKELKLAIAEIERLARHEEVRAKVRAKYKADLRERRIIR